MSKILQPRFRFDHLSDPISAKVVRPFPLPWFDSIGQLRPVITSLSLHPLKEQTVKNVSIGRYSA